MNYQLVGTNIWTDIWEVLSNRPSILPAKSPPIIAQIMWISFLSDKMIFWNLHNVSIPPASGESGLCDDSNSAELSRNCPQKLRITDSYPILCNKWICADARSYQSLWAKVTLQYLSDPLLILTLSTVDTVNDHIKSRLLNQLDFSISVNWLRLLNWQTSARI